MTTRVPMRSPAKQPTIMERVISWELAYRAVLEVLIAARVADAERIAADTAARLVVGTRD